VAYINANFASITGISQIAEQFYISKFHLCRVFREAMKVTVVEYLNRVRIQNACRYLRSSEKDVAEVAMLCGFHDAAYFSNVFKRVMGITPSAYRKE
jgi:AraC-like DNA-binding protein